VTFLRLSIHANVRARLYELTPARSLKILRIATLDALALSLKV